MNEKDLVRKNQIIKINYLVEEIKHNELISEKRKKIHKVLNYTQYLLKLASKVNGFLL